MRNSGSYQLVSEHSILSAQMKNKVAAVEEILEKQALHSKPEWKEELDKIKRHLQLRTKDDGGRRSRRDHASCDELSEKEFQIYLEMKLEWIQQFYVAANSSKPEQKTREPEEDGWNEPDFKVYDRGREELEEANSRRRRSREDEFYDKLEEMAEILGRYLSNVAGKSSKSDKERSPELEDVKPETDESETKKFKENRSQGSRDRSMVFVSENRSDDIRSWSAIGELSGTDAKPGRAEEEITPPDSPATTTEGGASKVEVASLIDLGEITLSCVTVLCNREKKDEEEESSETTLLGESSTEEEDGGVTVKVMGTVGDGNVFLSFENEKHDRFGKERRAGADWSSQDLGLLTEPMGQAEVTVSKSTQTLLFTPTQFIINEEVLQVKRKLDPVAISLGQSHNFIITPPIFTNSGGVLQVKREMGQKKEGISFNSKAGGLDKTMDPPNTLLVAENKAFDPGDSFSFFGIARSSCFKLWDPGGRPLMIVFLISSP